MNRLFLDTNFVLDLLGARAPWFRDMARITSMADRGELQLFTSAITLGTTDYFLSKEMSPAVSREKLRKFKLLCKVVPMDDSCVAKALESPFKDFEDALQHQCALDAGCDLILTRNPKDFRKSALPVLSAEAFLIRLKLQP